MPPRKRSPRPKVIWLTRYEVAEVVTLKCGTSRKPRYESRIRFEGHNYEAIVSLTKRDAAEAHDSLGAYCLGYDQTMDVYIARARAQALAEIGAHLNNRPVSETTGFEAGKAEALRKRMLERNRRRPRRP